MCFTGASRRGPTLRECILAHAVGRLTLGPAGLTNIQASWVKMGPDMAGELLRAGCNDLGGEFIFISVWATRLTSCFVYRGVDE